MVKAGFAMSAQLLDVRALLVEQDDLHLSSRQVVRSRPASAAVVNRRRAPLSWRA